MTNYKPPKKFNRPDIMQYYNYQMAEIKNRGYILARLLKNAKKSRQGIHQYLNRKCRVLTDVDDLILFIKQKNKSVFKLDK